MWHDTKIPHQLATGTNYRGDFKRWRILTTIIMGIALRMRSGSFWNAARVAVHTCESSSFGALSTRF